MPGEDRLGRGIKERESSREGPWQGPPLLQCYQHLSWEPVQRPAGPASNQIVRAKLFASSSSDYTPLRIRSRSSFSPVDMQQVLQKHTSVYCQRHLPNRLSALDTECPFGSHGRYVKYVRDGIPVIGGVGTCIRRWTFLLHCVSFSLVFVGRAHIIPADDLQSCIAQDTD